MKNLKTYESFNRKLQIGDYVVIGKDVNAVYVNIQIKAFEIGQLYDITPHYWFNFNGKKLALDPKDILYWSENKEELEANITSKKYNI